MNEYDVQKMQKKKEKKKKKRGLAAGCGDAVCVPGTAHLLFPREMPQVLQFRDAGLEATRPNVVRKRRWRP